MKAIIFLFFFIFLCSSAFGDTIAVFQIVNKDALVQIENRFNGIYSIISSSISEIQNLLKEMEKTSDDDSFEKLREEAIEKAEKIKKGEIEGATNFLPKSKGRDLTIRETENEERIYIVSVQKQEDCLNVELYGSLKRICSLAGIEFNVLSQAKSICESDVNQENKCCELVLGVEEVKLNYFKYVLKLEDRISEAKEEMMKNQQSKNQQAILKDILHKSNTVELNMTKEKYEEHWDSLMSTLKREVLSKSDFDFNPFLGLLKDINSNFISLRHRYLELTDDKNLQSIENQVRRVRSKIRESQKSLNSFKSPLEEFFSSANTDTSHPLNNLNGLSEKMAKVSSKLQVLLKKIDSEKISSDHLWSQTTFDNSQSIIDSWKKLPEKLTSIPDKTLTKISSEYSQLSISATQIISDVDFFLKKEGELLSSAKNILQKISKIRKNFSSPEEFFPLSEKACDFFGEFYSSILTDQLNNLYKFLVERHSEAVESKIAEKNEITVWINECKRDLNNIGQSIEKDNNSIEDLKKEIKIFDWKTLEPTFNSDLRKKQLEEKVSSVNLKDINDFYDRLVSEINLTNQIVHNDFQPTTKSGKEVLYSTPDNIEMNFCDAHLVLGPLIEELNSVIKTDYYSSSSELKDIKDNISILKGKVRSMNEYIKKLFEAFEDEKDLSFQIKHYSESSSGKEVLSSAPPLTAETEPAEKPLPQLEYSEEIKQCNNGNYSACFSAWVENPLNAAPEGKKNSREFPGFIRMAVSIDKSVSNNMIDIFDIFVCGKTENAYSFNLKWLTSEDYFPEKQRSISFPWHPFCGKPFICLRKSEKKQCWEIDVLNSSEIRFYQEGQSFLLNQIGEYSGQYEKPVKMPEFGPLENLNYEAHWSHSAN